MITKYYEKIKKIIKENYLFFLSMILLTILFYIPLPYYVYAPGGLVDVNDRFQVSNSYSTDGSFHLAYVSEYEATLPIYLFAKTQKEWTISKKSDVVASNETAKENDLRNHLLLKESNMNALMSAFSKAGKKVQIKSQKLMVSYVDETAKTKLKIGDQILKINNQTVKTKKELIDYIEKKKENDFIQITVLRNGKEKNVSATLLKIENKILLPIMNLKVLHL